MDWWTTNATGAPPAGESEGGSFVGRHRRLEARQEKFFLYVLGEKRLFSELTNESDSRKMESMCEKQLPLSSDLAFKMLLNDEESLKSLLQNFLPLPKGSLVVERRDSPVSKIKSIVLLA